ncbi:hypothetical protein CVT24_012611 [Panaeolus cyanescens]|uniref:PAS domain-containing protein n=1 Tax=Panaeolus cyanescens TaxID=181874 RepID=A0A409WD32_9AGAR|nr:hypothetical protein CVT24_012611 [Panaeolus cyanescens]
MRNYERSRRVVEVVEREREEGEGEGRRGRRGGGNANGHGQQQQGHPSMQGQGQKKPAPPAPTAVVMSPELGAYLRRRIKVALRSGKEGEKWFEEMGVGAVGNPVVQGAKEDEGPSTTTTTTASSSSSTPTTNANSNTSNPSLDAPETPDEAAFISQLMHPTSPYVSHVLHGVILRYMPDVVHVVSLKGSFLYVGGSVGGLVGWGEEGVREGQSEKKGEGEGERVGEGVGEEMEQSKPKPLSQCGIADFAFHGDVVPLMRELKEGSVGVYNREWVGGEVGAGANGAPSNSGPSMNALVGSMISRPKSVDVLFRAKTFVGGSSGGKALDSREGDEGTYTNLNSSLNTNANSSSNAERMDYHDGQRYVWIHARGRLLAEPGKGRKAIILTGRVGDMWGVRWRDVFDAGGITKGKRTLVSVPSGGGGEADKDKHGEGRKAGGSEGDGEGDESVRDESKRIPALRKRKERDVSLKPFPAAHETQYPTVKFTDVHTEFWAMLGGQGAGTTTLDWVGEGVADVCGWGRTEVLGLNVRKLFAVSETGQFDQAMKVERVVRAMRRIQRNKRWGVRDPNDDVVGEGEVGNRRWRKVRALLSSKGGDVVDVWVVIYRGDAEDDDEVGDGLGDDSSRGDEKQRAGANVSYAPLFAQIRLMDAEMCWNGMREGERDLGPALNPAARNASSGSDADAGQASKDYTFSTPLTSSSPSLSPDISLDTSKTRATPNSSNPSGSGSGRLANIFDILSVNLGTSWQYELQQRRFMAQRVAEELEMLERADLGMAGGVEGCLWARQAQQQRGMGMDTARKVMESVHRVSFGGEPRKYANFPNRGEKEGSSMFQQPSTFSRQGVTLSQRVIDQGMRDASDNFSAHMQGQLPHAVSSPMEHRPPPQQPVYNMPFPSYPNLTSAPLPPPDGYDAPVHHPLPQNAYGMYNAYGYGQPFDGLAEIEMSERGQMMDMGEVDRMAMPPPSSIPSRLPVHLQRASSQNTMHVHPTAMNSPSPSGHPPSPVIGPVSGSPSQAYAAAAHHMHMPIPQGVVGAQYMNQHPHPGASIGGGGQGAKRRWGDM